MIIIINFIEINSVLFTPNSQEMLANENMLVIRWFSNDITDM